MVPAGEDVNLKHARWWRFDEAREVAADRERERVAHYFSVWGQIGRAAYWAARPRGPGWYRDDLRADIAAVFR
jgi:hypothetical protein